MPIPNYQTLMLPVLEIAAAGESSVPIATAQIAGRFGLSEAEVLQRLPSDKQTVLHNRIHWAKFYLKRAGLLEFPQRGRFKITPFGQQLLAKPPASLNTEYLLTIPEFKTFYQGTGANPDGAAAAANPATPEASTATPEEVIEAAQAKLSTALRDELLDRVLQNSPAFFERLIIELLVAMRYGGSRADASRHLGMTGDGGVDGVINEDVLGLDRVFVQAKRHAPGNTIGRRNCRRSLASLVGQGATKGVFVTTATFADTAVQCARYIPQRISLIDGERLTELMIEHGVGVRTSRTVVLQRLDEDFFTEE